MIEFCISFFIEKYSKFIDNIRSGNFIDTFCQKYWQIPKKSPPHPLHGILLHWLYFTLPYFFFLCWSPSLYLCMVFDSISSNIGEVLSINSSANVLLLFFLIGIHSMEGWTTTTRYGVTRKEAQKRITGYISVSV